MNNVDIWIGCTYVHAYMYVCIYVYMMEYHLSMKQKEILPFTRMVLEDIMLNEARQRPRSYDLTYMWNLEKIDKN